MNPKILAKILSAMVFGIVLAMGQKQFASSRGTIGKEAFLAAQAQRYDKFYAKPRSPFFGVAILLAGAVFGAYELLALGIYATIKPGKTPEET